MSWQDLQKQLTAPSCPSLCRPRWLLQRAWDWGRHCSPLPDWTRWQPVQGEPRRPCVGCLHFGLLELCWPMTGICSAAARSLSTPLFPEMYIHIFYLEQLRAEPKLHCCHVMHAVPVAVSYRWPRLWAACSESMTGEIQRLACMRGSYR